MAKGSVVKKSGSYYAVYRVDGKQRWEKAGPTKRLAEKLLAQRLNEVNTGAFQEESKVTFREFAEIWLRDYVAPNVKRSTFISYETIIRKHLCPFFGDMKLARIKPGTIHNFLAELARNDVNSQKTILNIIVPFKEMFKHAMQWGYIRVSPAELVKRPRVDKREMSFLTSEEIQKFLNHVSDKYRPFYMTAAMTGMRKGELLSLTWDDIDFAASRIYVRRSLFKGQFVSPKTKHSIRSIDISPMLKDALRKHRQAMPKNELGLVFPNEQGNVFTSEYLTKTLFQATLLKAGLKKIRFHDLRHSYTSILLQQGENAKFVQSQLGHSSAAMTLDRYGHLIPGSVKEFGERLDNSIFGETDDSVRKLLENPTYEEIQEQRKTPEDVDPQGLS